MDARSPHTTRRELLKATGVGLAYLSAPGLVRAGESGLQRPNLVFLFTDDQRWDAMGCAGNPVIQTPHMDALANEGMLFRNAFATTAICPVSRVSTLLGQNAGRHKIRDFAAAPSALALSQSYPALLRAAGYTGAFVGKWGAGRRDQDAIERSATNFDYWAGYSEQGSYWHQDRCQFVTHDGFEAANGSICDCPADDQGHRAPQTRRGRANLVEPLHLTTQIVPDKVTQFLDGREHDKPFCLSISFKAPHGPLEDFDPRVAKLYRDVEMPLPTSATPEAAAKTPAFLQASHESARARKLIQDRSLQSALQVYLRNYYRQMTSADIAVGKIREILNARGLSRNTVILLSSDHGRFFGEHGLFGKWMMYEESIRVPMILFDPRLSNPERSHRCDEMVLNIDIAPTLLDLAGLPIPQRMQGKSMAPLLTRPELPFREHWFYEHHFSAPPAISIERSEGVRTRKLKYISYIDQAPPYEEFYDLSADPHELENRVGDPAYQKALGKLRAQYAELRAKS